MAAARPLEARPRAEQLPAITTNSPARLHYEYPAAAAPAAAWAASEGKFRILPKFCNIPRLLALLSESIID